MWQLFDRMTYHGKVFSRPRFVDGGCPPSHNSCRDMGQNGWSNDLLGIRRLAAGGGCQVRPVLERRVASRPVDGASLDPSACMHDVL